MRVIDQETQLRMENAGSLDKYMLYHLYSGCRTLFRLPHMYQLRVTRYG